MAVLRSVATALPKCSKQGGWWGLMVVGQSEAIAERPGLNFGVVVGGDGGIACALEKTEGGKAPAAYLRGSFSRTTNTAPKNYDCDENDCAPFAPGSPTRPTGVRARFQSEAAAGVPLRRRPRRGRHQYGLRGKGWQR